MTNSGQDPAAIGRAQQNKDTFALTFHLEPLLLTAFLRWQWPHGSPCWAWRTPLVRNATSLPGGAVRVGEPELQRLVGDLSRQLEVEPKAWAAWAARGWCHHLLGDAGRAVQDVKKAIELRADEPGLWALLGTVSLKQQPEQAEAAQVRLAGWPGVDVALWHRLEADACRAEGAPAGERWHRSHLPAR
jgi:hypothetical protein